MENLSTINRHTLWLAYEKVPHPDAVSYPADERDVRLALGLLAYPRLRRAQLAERLREILLKISGIPACERLSIPARTPDRNYRPIPWRFAQWLACVLRCEGTARERLTGQLEYWLQNGANSGGSVTVLRNQFADGRK